MKCESLVGFYPGVWDLLHVGHLHALRDAHQQCDKLVVGVPSDGVVLRDKGKLPVIPCNQRMEMLAGLSFVDEVLEYICLEFITPLRITDARVLFIGETWGGDDRHRQAEQWIQHMGGRCVTIPYCPDQSTTNIREAILNGRTASPPEDVQSRYAAT